jgi:hypothetical protein
MNIWRKNYPRVLYQPVAIIHGVAYNVKDEVVFKRHECEWILPHAVAKHLKYNPRHLPVVIEQSGGRTWSLPSVEFF